MSFDTIRLEQSHGMATITLNRPATLNAITLPMIDDIHRALDQALKDGARCLLLTGEGKAFSSGADLAAGLGDFAADPDSFDIGLVLERGYNPLMLRLADLPMPIVTAVNGAAAGAGCSLALAGDIVLAAPNAYFLQAFVNIGLVPDAGSSWLLPQLVGKARAQAMMMLGERIPAHTAQEWGMIHAVAAEGALMEEAHAIALKLAQGPTQALAMIRKTVRFALEHDFAAVLQRERDDQRSAGRTTDFREGVAAFMAKRPAQFSGK